MNNREPIKEEAMKQKTRITVHFMDGTHISLQQPESATDPSTVVTELRKGLDSDKLIAQVDDSLFVIPGRNVKYLQVTPCPKKLPEGMAIMRGASVAD